MPEVHRLLQALTAPGAPVAQCMHWSHWRRAHQVTAQRCHRARRARPYPPAADPAVVVVVVPGTPALTEAHWTQLAPLLPTTGRRGPPWRDHRRMLEGILWVMRTGAGWRALPLTFGAWQTAYDRYARWRRDGTWTGIRTVLLSSFETLTG